MTKLVTAFAALLVFAATAALAQDKAEKKAAQVSVHQITENDKVKVYEVTYKVGAENKGVAASTMRVVRAIRGGRIERTYADGRTETVDYRPGQVRIQQPGPAYTTKNVGKSVLVLYVVQLK
jgi:Ni/Co efflux regulator RcnB